MVAVELCHCEQNVTVSQCRKTKYNCKVYKNILVLRSAAGAPAQLKRSGTYQLHRKS